MRPPALTTLACVGALLGSGWACGSADATDPGAKAVQIGSDGQTSISTSFTFEADDSVRYELSIHGGTGPSQREARINGLLLQLSEHGFQIGNHRYDGLQAGDRVLVSAGGIFVNGLHRWDLPSD